MIESNAFNVDIPQSGMCDSLINHKAQKYPCCLVWTPIPVLTWFFPFIGHMGICTSIGIIRDFAAAYHVNTDKFSFGKPTKYLKLDPLLARGGIDGWDRGVAEASDIYKGRSHKLFFDNCHSHVAMALNIMLYNNSDSWNAVKLGILMFVNGKYVDVRGFLKTWLPFVIVAGIFIAMITLL